MCWYCMCIDVMNEPADINDGGDTTFRDGLKAGVGGVVAEIMLNMLNISVKRSRT